MAQAFVTTYEQDYQWKHQDPPKPILNCSPEELANLDADLWLSTIFIEESLQDPEIMRLAQAKVDRLNRRRLWTTYQKAYCKDMIREVDRKYTAAIDTTPVVDDVMENPLIEEGLKRFRKHDEKVPGPLASSARILGYLRPTNMHIPNSTYGDHYCKIATDILDKKIIIEKICPKQKEEELRNEIRMEEERKLSADKVSEILNNMVPTTVQTPGKQCQCSEGRTCPNCLLVQGLNLRDYKNF